MLDQDKLHAGLCAGIQECVDTLGYGEMVVGEFLLAPPTQNMGAYISLVGDTESIELGVVADHAGCQRLAGVMLGLEEEDGPIPESELGDAMGELLNMIAGTVKTQLREHGLSVRLGLPMFCRGQVEVSKGSQHRYFDVKIGDVETVCVVHRHQTGEAAA